MSEDDPVVQRAIEIARSGRCTSVVQIRNQLAKEGRRDVERHLLKPKITDKLRALITARRRAEPLRN